MKVKIINGNHTTTLDFNEESGKVFLQAVQNCIDNSKEYPSINYDDKKYNIIFPADYLKNSLIINPK